MRQLQVTVLCSRIFHEATKDPIPNFLDLPVLRLAKSLGRLVPEDCDDSKLFKKIATSGHVWLAQKLLETRPREAVGTGSLGFLNEPELLVFYLEWLRESVSRGLRGVVSSIETVSGSDDPPAILSKLGLLANYCQQLLESRKESGVISRSSLSLSLISHLHSLRESASRGFLSTIDTRIEETRQYRHARYAAIRLERWRGSAPAAFLEKDRADYAMTALAQVNLARFQQFHDFDLRYTWRLFRENRDKLGWLRLLVILQPCSKTAKQAVSAWDAHDWENPVLVFKIEFELKRTSHTRLAIRLLPSTAAIGVAGVLIALIQLLLALKQWL
jgi:hypothetical protein